VIAARPPWSRSFWAWTLSLLMLAVPAQAMQQPGTPAPKDSLPPPLLRIYVLEGDNAINSIPLNRAVTPIVEVRDPNENPIEGASVTFSLPEAGPGGVYPGNRRDYTTRTSSQGQASGQYILNHIPGKFSITVTAESNGRKGTVTIMQTNSAESYFGPPLAKTPVMKRWSTWLIIGAVAAAAITIPLVLLNDSSNTTTTGGTLVIAPGSPIFGGR